MQNGDQCLRVSAAPAGRVASEGQATRLGGDVDGRAVEQHAAVGAAHDEAPVGEQLEVPATLVDEVVVLTTERQQVVEVGRAAVLHPCDDVMDVAVPEPHGAVGEPAAAVHRP